MDLYGVLGVGRGATDKDIRAAYRKLAVDLHPDKPGGNKDRFQKLNEAYGILSDPEKRRNYDHQQRPAASDRIVEVQVTLEEMCRGCSKSANITFDVACAGCGGRGVIIRILMQLNGFFKVLMQCTQCRGTGRLSVETQEVHFRVPSGCAENYVLRVSDRASIRITSLPHATFTRVGPHDLRTEMHISLYESLTGFACPLTHLNGKTYRLRYPDKALPCKPGAQVAVPGMGMSAAGRLFIHFVIDYPSVFDGSFRLLLKTQWPQSMRGDPRPTHADETSAELLA